MKKTIYVKISDVPFKLMLTYPRLEEFYENFIHPPEESAIEIEVSDDMFEAYSGTSKSSAEVFWQCKLVGDGLVKCGKMILHGCSFLWKGKAYVFTGPSGVGKTTQFMLWRKLFGGEVNILNGDKTVLDFTENGVFVRPSPWRGKERMSEMHSAPLEAIICLRQASENRIERLEPSRVAQNVFEQVIFSSPDAESIMAAAKLTEKLLYSVKLWQLDNLGDDNSAVLCHDTLEGEL